MEEQPQFRGKDGVEYPSFEEMEEANKIFLDQIYPKPLPKNEFINKKIIENIIES